MSVKRIVPIFKVANIQQSLDFYCSILGFSKDFHYSGSKDGPDYVGISLDGHHLHLSTFPGDGPGGTPAYLYVDDVDALYDEFLAAGFADPNAKPVNQMWGQRELYVRDLDGNTLRFGSAPVKGGS